jgi:hypothetical protein
LDCRRHQRNPLGFDSPIFPRRFVIRSGVSGSTTIAWNLVPLIHRSDLVACELSQRLTAHALCLRQASFCLISFRPRCPTMSMLFYNVFQPEEVPSDPCSPHNSQQSIEESQAQTLRSHTSTACKAAVWIGPRADVRVLIFPWLRDCLFVPVT